MLAPCQSGQLKQFGYSVAAAAGAILCGAPGAPTGVPESAHLFRYDAGAWHETARLSQLDPNMVFGTSVAMKSDVAMVGAPGVPPGGPVPAAFGRAYFFGFCTGDTDGDGSVDVNDLVAVLQAWGSPGYGAADLDCDGDVDVQDLTLVIINWGLCPLASGSQPLSLCDEFEAAGLTLSNCSAFRNNLGDANYGCWTLHYLTVCSPSCTQAPSCPSSDPYRTGRH
jgi:hypothetical protein